MATRDAQGEEEKTPSAPSALPTASADDPDPRRAQVIPSLQGDASTQSPPDLPSFIFKERIVYLVRERPRRRARSRSKIPPPAPADRRGEQNARDCLAACFSTSFAPETRPRPRSPPPL